MLPIDKFSMDNDWDDSDDNRDGDLDDDKDVGGGVIISGPFVYRDYKYQIIYFPPSNDIFGKPTEAQWAGEIIDNQTPIQGDNYSSVETNAKAIIDSYYLEVPPQDDEEEEKEEEEKEEEEAEPIGEYVLIGAGMIFAVLYYFFNTTGDADGN